MPFFIINGFEILCSANRNRGEDEQIGAATRRAFDGTLLSSVRAHKESWTIETIPYVYDSATAILELLRGSGHHWGFENATYYLYSSKYKLNGALTGAIVRSVAQQRFGVASLYFPSGADTRWSFPEYDYPITIMYWERTGATWQHRALVWDTGAIIRFFSNGVQLSSAQWSALADRGFADAEFDLPNIIFEATANVYLDDLVILPYALTPAMIAAFAASDVSFSSLSNLFLTGDIVGDVTKTIRCVDPISFDLRALSDGTTWHENQKIIRATVREI